MPRVSAIKDLDHYERRVYTSRYRTTLSRRGSSIVLELGDVFYIRPAGSSPNTWRVVLDATDAGGKGHGVNYVYSLDLETFRAIQEASLTDE